jgi:hypothetical protein
MSYGLGGHFGAALRGGALDAAIRRRREHLLLVKRPAPRDLSAYAG